MKLSNIEKDKQPQAQLLRLFEKTRVAYLSALHDQQYSSRWRKVSMIEESYNQLDAGNELKDYIDEEELLIKKLKPFFTTG